MTFEFQLLSLLLLFLLIIVYYTNKDNFTKGNKIFRGLLLVTYIIQLINSAIYITNEIGSNNITFSKLYLITINLWFGLLSIYYIATWLKEKKLEPKTSYILHYIGIIFIIFQIISNIFILIAPLTINNLGIDYYSHFIICFICLYLSIELIILLIERKQIETKTYIHLITIYIIELIMFLLQPGSPEISLFNIGVILITYYSYFMLENSTEEELKNITLERDYTKKQCIDKRDFLKVLSHEIRTPLNTIDGFSQVIMESDNLEEIKTDAEDIRLASKDLIDVINGMIDLSIIESGNLEIIEENYNIYDTLENIQNIAKSKMRDKLVEFKTEIDRNIPEVLLGDSERISQVILNLLTNAIKYTEKGNITLQVDSVKSSTRCRLKIIVSDTGKGIKKEDLNTIFSKNEAKEGGSLGLAISKYLTELMGGSIEVESTYEVGSKFTVTLDQKIISDIKEEKTTHKKILKPFSAKDKKILLVDDNKLNLKVATKLLQPYEVEVTEASSGKECLDILEKNTDFDLILMDDLMPEMSGTECLDILKKIERVDGYYIPVVVLTANAVTGMKEKYLNAGFEDYLAKPIDKYELDRILKKYLKGKK